MPPMHAELLRCAIRVVCEILISELKELLVREKRKLLQNTKKTHNGYGTNTATSSKENQLAKGKKSKVQRKSATKRRAPMPMTVVNVVDSSGENADNELILPDDPLSSIQIKQELPDDLTFEEHFEDLSSPSLKRELKQEEFSDRDDEILEHTVQDSSNSSDSTEAPRPKRKAKGKSKQASVRKGKKTSLKITSVSSQHQSHVADKIKHKCGYCSQTFDEIDKLNQHTLTHKKQQISHERDIGIYICKQCKKRFSKLFFFNKHKILHTKSCTTGKISKKYSIRSHRNSKLQAKLSHKCRYCLKRFDCRIKFIKHVMYIHGKNPYAHGKTEKKK